MYIHTTVRTHAPILMRVGVCTLIYGMVEGFEGLHVG